MLPRSAGLMICTAALCLGSVAAAAPLMPVIDEFWVLKNGAEVFRDSFDDGSVPPSGPQDGVGGNPDTYTVFGPGGMASETSGKLTMVPSFGAPTLITSAFSDLGTQANKLRTTLPGAVNSLDLADSFEIHGLYDLSSLPVIIGQFFGIRATDRAQNLGNEGNDTIQLIVGRNIVTGELGVALHELDFALDTIDRVDFFSLDALLGTADQIEFVISKAANTAEIGATFNLYDSGALVLTHAMDTFSTEKGANLAIYDGETYTRAAFVSGDRINVPEPTTFALLGLGLAGLGLMRRRRAA